MALSWLTTVVSREMSNIQALGHIAVGGPKIMKASVNIWRNNQRSVMPKARWPAKTSAGSEISLLGAHRKLRLPQRKQRKRRKPGQRPIIVSESKY